ncbi:NTP transferase domain-containing protein, partial [Rhodococcus sp. GG48]|nr:NTP transferase domain-containing protein [Rhodococcus sp. GG48]
MQTFGPPGGHPAAIVLAGGRATRMGGIDKPGLVVAGRRMLDTARGRHHRGTARARPRPGRLDSTRSRRHVRRHR